MKNWFISAGTVALQPVPVDDVIAVKTPIVFEFIRNSSNLIQRGLFAIVTGRKRAINVQKIRRSITEPLCSAAMTNSLRADKIDERSFGHHAVEWEWLDHVDFIPESL